MNFYPQRAASRRQPPANPAAWIVFGTMTITGASGSSAVTCRMRRIRCSVLPCRPGQGGDGEALSAYLNHLFLDQVDHFLHSLQ